MMTVPLEQPAWPSGDPGKVLLHFVADGNVDALFEDFFGVYPELQAKLHRQRNDTNVAESPWVASRAQLPQQQFLWPAPPAGADPGVAALGSCRKVRFEAAPSLASKAFSSEEVQTLLSCSPGSHYLVESEVYTSAMYGDQFCIISRYTLLAKGPSQTHLHLTYAINFKPTLNRLVRPMVAKGVDGGIRGTFGLLRKLLQEKYTLTDLADTATPPSLPEAANLAAAAAAVPGAAAAVEAAPVTQVPAAAAAAAATAPLFGLADYIVYQELVASLLTLPDPRLVAQGLAMCLTLALLQLLIAFLRPVSQACHAAAAASHSSGVVYGLSGLLCWPVTTGLLDVPDNVLEVVASMLLVAVANKLLIMLVELGAAMAKASTAPPASVQPSAVEALQTLAEAALAQPSIAAGTGQAAAGAAPAGVPGGLGSRAPSSSSSPVPIPARTPVPPPGAAGSAGGSSGGGELLSQVVTGWGKMVDTLSSNEGFKVLLGGTWLRPDQSAKQGPPEAQSAAVSDRLAARASLSNAPSHRHTTSFTTVMDPSGLNIIEDYAQMEAELLPGMEEVPERSTHSSPAAARASLLAVADDDSTGSSAAAAAVNVADGAAVSPRSHSLPALQSPAGSDPARSRTSSPSRPPSRLSHGVTPAAAAAAAAAAGSNDIVVSPSGNGVQQEPPAEGSMGNGSRSTTPPPSAPAPAALTSRASSAPPHPPGSQQQQQKSKAVKISQSKEAPERSSSGVFGSSGSRGNAASVLLSRRSASPVVYGELAAASSNSLGSRGGGGSGTKLRAGELAEASGGSYDALAAAAPYVAPGEEDEDEVLVEVFEHERVQPFRGWGHTWPGHFLPSDKVGHWGDRQGAPGGDASMLFDRVAPKLPAGWAWKDAEWQVDMGDQEVESCDAEGWSYGMDFSWLQWPPTPQSGRAGLKSFVRRRRWVRTRMRLPPGCYEEQLLGQQEAQDSLLAGLSSSGIPLQELTAGVGGRQASSGGGEAGLIAGLGSGLGSGLGLGSEGGAAAAATAAAAAASAMYTRFLRVVEDTVTGSGGGAAKSRDGSPSAAAAAAAAADTARWDVHEVDQPSTRQGQQQRGQQAAVGSEAAAHTGGAATAFTSSSSTSNEAASESGNESDSDSSSVDSNAPVSRPLLPMPLEAAQVAAHGADAAGLPAGEPQAPARQHEQQWQARRHRQQETATQEQEGKHEVQSINPSTLAEQQQQHSAAGPLSAAICEHQEHDRTAGAGPAAAQVTDASPHELGLLQPTASGTAAASDTAPPDTAQHSTADPFARQEDLCAGSAAVNSATDAGAASQQPGALQTAQPTNSKAAQVGCAAPAISSSAPGGAADVPVVPAARQPVESVAGPERPSHTATDTAITPAAAGTPCEPEPRTPAMADSAGGKGEAVRLHEAAVWLQPIQSQGSDGWAWSTAAAPDHAVAAAAAPAAGAVDVQPAAASSDSVGAEQQQLTAAAGDASGATASMPGAASEQAGPAAAATFEASSSSLTAGPPRQLRLRAQGSQDGSHLGSGGSVTPTVAASTSPSGGSGQRSSTLRPRSSSGSGSSKPGAKKLGAVPLRSSADNSLRSSGSGRLLSPQTSTDGGAEAADASQGLQATVGIATTAASGNRAALQPSSKPPFDTSDVASGSSSSRPSAAITSDMQPKRQQGDAAAANQSGVGTAAGTAALDDPDSVGSSAGLTTVNLTASGSQATAVHVPAVGTAAADGGANELGSGLTSWAPDADGCVGSSGSSSNSTTSAVMRSRRGGLGAGAGHAAQSRLDKDK